MLIWARSKCGIIRHHWQVYVPAQPWTKISQIKICIWPTRVTFFVSQSSSLFLLSSLFQLVLSRSLSVSGAPGFVGLWEDNWSHPEETVGRAGRPHVYHLLRQTLRPASQAPQKFSNTHHAYGWEKSTPSGAEAAGHNFQTRDWALGRCLHPHTSVGRGHLRPRRYWRCSRVEPSWWAASPWSRELRRGTACGRLVLLQEEQEAWAQDWFQSLLLASAVCHVWGNVLWSLHLLH